MKKKKYVRSGFLEVLNMARDLERDLGRLISEQGLRAWRSMDKARREETRDTFLQRTDDLLARASVVPQGPSLRTSLRSVERLREAMTFADI